MSAHKGSVTLACNGCSAIDEFDLTTVKATRERAIRYGWRVSLQGDPRAGASNDPRKPDLCPVCARADQ